ncbi:hypothetical protein RGQ29_032081 [Quercus rubra]|uniref:non-specific serine/threonine protein kinase n=1 Tax=Quercus rubra TaxID=3512 RepID=A0AAN7I571_QUERU|nr:hypothetical protein RGQ29_032081 [Quercus rubra]
MAAGLTSLHFLITLYFILKVPLMFAQADQFIYNDFREANLHLDGTARIHPNGLLQLTNNSQQEVGHAFHRLPLKFNTSSSGLTQAPSFSTNFVFAIVPETPSKGGHGIAFTISPSWQIQNDSYSNYLGLLNASKNGLSTNHLLAIELDTTWLRNLKSNESATATYFSDQEGKNISVELVSGKPMHLWIDYNETKKLLNVTLAPAGITKPNRPLLSTRIDLSQYLLESMYCCDQYILGWSFNKSGQAQSLDISKLPQPPQRRKSKDRQGQIIMILIIAVVVVLILVTVAIFVLRRQEICRNTRRLGKASMVLTGSATRISTKQPKVSQTRSFLENGGFGKVYKGTLRSSNTEIAVKKVSHDSKQGMKEFVAEIISMGRLRHRNFLEKFLYGNERTNLNWLQRFQILKGVASGLLYLHEEWDQVVLHRDIKSSNVLLDAELNGKLGDFGLARLCDHGAILQTTRVAGTVGYLAPELSKTGRATTYTDVACGRKPIEIRGLPEEVILVDWVFGCWRKGAILDASDPKLEGNYVVKEMELVLKLGLLCSHSTPAVRPSMREVMQLLDGNADLQELPHASTSFGNFTNVEASEILLSINSAFEKGFTASSSTDSVLYSGR